MKFFIDTANIEEIKSLSETGLIDGVTTNPTLIAKSGNDIKDTIRNICKIIKGPVSAEVTAINSTGMIEEGKILFDIAENVVVKVPLTFEGLIACNKLREIDIAVNVTLCFSSSQALLAAKAGATFISPFIGRLDDIGLDGMNLISEIRTIYDNYDNITTEILAASIRTNNHVINAALQGADVATIPPKILKELFDHPLTKSGLDTFLDDWGKTGQKIV
ncbi:MAG: fructose-6-phosphate aldolase [Rhodobiaceae bacterium]|nr:fructose-6-phosphate aldolase [Rhodobiaceae bacterium]